MPSFAALDKDQELDSDDLTEPQSRNEQEQRSGGSDGIQGSAAAEAEFVTIELDSAEPESYTGDCELEPPSYSSTEQLIRWLEFTPVISHFGCLCRTWLQWCVLRDSGGCTDDTADTEASEPIERRRT